MPCLFVTTGGNNFKESLKTAFELLNNTQKDDRVNNRKADSEIFLISDGITRESVGETIAFAKQQSLITKSKIVTFEFTSRATKNSFMKRLATSEVRNENLMLCVLCCAMLSCGAFSVLHCASLGCIVLLCFSYSVLCCVALLCVGLCFGCIALLF